MSMPAGLHVCDVCVSMHACTHTHTHRERERHREACVCVWVGGGWFAQTEEQRKKPD